LGSFLLKHAQDGQLGNKYYNGMDLSRESDDFQGDRTSPNEQKTSMPYRTRVIV
jgi:hypothetical protein